MNISTCRWLVSLASSDGKYIVPFVSRIPIGMNKWVIDLNCPQSSIEFWRPAPAKKQATISIVYVWNMCSISCGALWWTLQIIKGLSFSRSCSFCCVVFIVTLLGSVSHTHTEHYSPLIMLIVSNWTKEREREKGKKFPPLVHLGFSYTARTSKHYCWQCSIIMALWTFETV